MVSEKSSILVKFWNKKVHFDLYAGRLIREYIPGTLENGAAFKLYGLIRTGCYDSPDVCYWPRSLHRTSRLPRRRRDV